MAKRACPSRSRCSVAPKPRSEESQADEGRSLQCAQAFHQLSVGNKDLRECQLRLGAASHGSACVRRASARNTTWRASLSTIRPASVKTGSCRPIEKRQTKVLLQCLHRLAHGRLHTAEPAGAAEKLPASLPRSAPDLVEGQVVEHPSLQR